MVVTAGVLRFDRGVRFLFELAVGVLLLPVAIGYRAWRNALFAWRARGLPKMRPVMRDGQLALFDGVRSSPLSRIRRWSFHGSVRRFSMASGPYFDAVITLETDDGIISFVCEEYGGELDAIDAPVSRSLPIGFLA